MSKSVVWAVRSGRMMSEKDQGESPGSGRVISGGIKRCSQSGPLSSRRALSPRVLGQSCISRVPAPRPTFACRTMPSLQPNLGSFVATASLQVAWPFSGGQTGCREASCACRPSLPPVTRARRGQWATAPGRLAASRWAITSPMPSLPPVPSSSNHQVPSNRQPHRIDRGPHQSLCARTPEGHADGRTCIVVSDPMRGIAVRCNGNKPMIFADRRPRDSSAPRPDHCTAEVGAEIPRSRSHRILSPPACHPPTHLQG